MRFFCSDLINFADYSIARKIPELTAEAIKFRLGEPTEETPLLTKKQIVEMGEGSYETLRASVQKYPDRFGISPEAFAKLKVFPTAVAEKIRKQYRVIFW